MFNKNTHYAIDDLKIELNKKHKLPEYQNQFPMYDRFLPCLADCFVDSKGWIIDIGANVGDTTFAVIKHTKANVLAVEPAKLFYDLLEKNINSLPSELSERIKLEKAFVTSKKQLFSVKVTDGTAVMEETTDSDAPALTIVDLLKKNGIDAHDVAVIKSDTDGYDADCIMSAGELFNDCSPILFYENQIDNMDQMNSFNTMSEYLQEHGYCNYYVFDNFGNYLCKTDSVGMKSINGYLDRINRQISARTFFYVDVMACKDSSVAICENAIASYLKKYEK